MTKMTTYSWRGDEDRPASGRLHAFFIAPAHGCKIAGKPRVQRRSLGRISRSGRVAWGSGLINRRTRNGAKDSNPFLTSKGPSFMNATRP